MFLYWEISVRIETNTDLTYSIDVASGKMLGNGLRN